MFSLDRRGGHNRYDFNRNFFKKWSPEMAYVLGFMYADGNITDSIPSRAQYVSFDSNDRDILEKIKVALASNHKIQTKPEKTMVYSKGVYTNKEGFRLRIGSRKMFEDLLRLGVTPRKSLTIEFPKHIPKNCLNHFIRGYFDGDGCVHIMRGKGKYGQEILKGLRVIFTSGSKVFLDQLCNELETVGFKNGKIYFSSRAYSLKYATSESTEFFKFLYSNNGSDLLLKRKFDVFSRYFQLRPNRKDRTIEEILK